MTWWRVEVNSSGRVLSCKRVDNRAPDSVGNRVFYVPADDQTQAEAAAYRLHKLAQREAMKVRRARHKAQGLCRCGRKVPANREQCDVCIGGANAAKARTKAIKRGEPVAPLPPKSEAFARNREQREQQLRLEVFELVHRVWCRTRNDKAFTAWLVAQIRDLKGKVAA